MKLLKSSISWGNQSLQSTHVVNIQLCRLQRETSRCTISTRFKWKRVKNCLRAMVHRPLTEGSALIVTSRRCKSKRIRMERILLRFHLRAECWTVWEPKTWSFRRENSNRWKLMIISMSRILQQALKMPQWPNNCSKCNKCSTWRMMLEIWEVASPTRWVQASSQPLAQSLLMVGKDTIL